MIASLFYALFFLVPLIFFPKTSEVFEFNKMVAVYIITVLIITAWVIKMIKNRKIIFRRTMLDIPLLLFLGSQLLSTIISIDPQTSLFGYYSRFNGGLFSTICYSLLYWAFVSNMNQKSSRRTIFSILLSATIVAIYGILEHFGRSISCILVTGRFNNACWVQNVQERVFATLGQPNWLAAFLTALVPLSFYFALQEKSPKKKLAYIAVSLLFFICILFTKSRSGLMGLGIALIVFWLPNLRKHFKILTLTVICLLTITAIFGTVFTPSLREIISQEPQNQKVDTGEGGTESGAIREIVWKGALGIARSYPLLGTGVETFGYSYWQFRPLAHNATSEWDFLYNKAHNEYLNFLANSGIIGLGTYLIMIGAAVFTLRKNYALLAGFISILITNFFGFSVVVISLLTFLFPAIAVTLFVNSKPQTSSAKLGNSQKAGIGIAIILACYLLFAIFKYWQADYLYRKSMLECQSKLYESCVKDLHAAISLSPRESIYHNQMARVLLQISTKLAPYALSESDTAFSLSPRNMNIRETRMGIYLQLGAIDPKYFNLAVSLIKDTIPLSPTDPKLELILGKAYAGLNQLDKSAEAFRTALQLKPDYQDAQKDLEVIQKLQGKNK